MKTLFFDHFDNNRIYFYYILNFGCYTSTDLTDILGGRRYAFSRQLQRLFPEENINKGQKLALILEKPATKNYVVKLYEQKGEASAKGSAPRDYSLYLDIFKAIGQYRYFNITMLEIILQQSQSCLFQTGSAKPRAPYFRLRSVCQELEKLGYLTTIVPSSPLYKEAKEGIVEFFTELILKQGDISKEEAEDKAYQDLDRNKPLLYKTEDNFLDQLNIMELKSLYIALGVVKDVFPISSLLYSIMFKIHSHCLKFEGSLIKAKWLDRIRANNAYQGRVLTDEILLNLLLAAEQERPVELDYYDCNRLEHKSNYKGIPQAFTYSTPFSRDRVKLVLEDGSEKNLFLDCSYLTQATALPLYHELFGKSFLQAQLQSNREVPYPLTRYERAYLKTLLQLKGFVAILDSNAPINKPNTRKLTALLKTTSPLPLQKHLKYIGRSTPFTLFDSKANSEKLAKLVEALKNNKKLAYTDTSTGENKLLNPFELVFQPGTCSFVLTGLLPREGFVTLKLSKLETLQLTDEASSLNEDELYTKPIRSVFLKGSDREPIPKFKKYHLLLETPLLDPQQAYRLFSYLRPFRKVVQYSSRPKGEPGKCKPNDEKGREGFAILLQLNELYAESRPEKLLLKLHEEGLISSIAAYDSEELSRKLMKINK